MLQDAQGKVLDLLLEFFNTGNTKLADQIFTSHSEVHTPDRVWRGTQEILSNTSATRAAFPDIHFVDESRFADGDRVVFQWSVAGTHQGEFMGIPATGQRVELRGVSVAQIENGRIVEEVTYYDRLAVLEQLGVVARKREVPSAAG